MCVCVHVLPIIWDSTQIGVKFNYGYNNYYYIPIRPCEIIILLKISPIIIIIPRLPYFNLLFYFLYAYYYHFHCSIELQNSSVIVLYIALLTDKKIHL